MRHTNRLHLAMTLLGAISIAMAASGCELTAIEKLSKKDGPPAEEMRGLAKIKLVSKAHGAISDLESARIKITSVQVRSTQGEWFSFGNEPFEIDLVSQLNMSDVLARGSGQAGEYDHVRLITEEEGIAVLSDGTEIPLRVPSGPQTGIKIKFAQPIRIENCSITVGTLDFDLSKSFVGTAKDVHFKPVVHARSSGPVVVNNTCPVNPGTGDNGTGSDDGSNPGDSGTGSDDGVDPNDGNDDLFPPILGV